MSLTKDAAKELGRGLRFIRLARNMTLRDVSKRSDLSPQYVQNLERGERPNASQEAYLRLARGYDIPQVVVSDLLLKARVLSALELRGVDKDGQGFVWRGVEQRLGEIGIDLSTDLARVVSSMLGDGMTDSSRHPSYAPD